MPEITAPSTPEDMAIDLVEFLAMLPQSSSDPFDAKTSIYLAAKQREAWCIAPTAASRALAAEKRVAELQAENALLREQLKAEDAEGDNVNVPRLVYVRWFDSAIYQLPAFNPGDMNDGPCRNESAGLLIRDEPEWIALALDRCIDTGYVRLVLRIPRVNVLSIQYFYPTKNVAD